MFLLFLELTLQYPQEGRHLHSNMFLLFRIWTTNSRLCVRNLHSNMFLLFLGRELRFLQSAIIYIPICFYYFKYADCDDDEIAIFTFQYVSIISYVAEVGGCFAHNLHSNMFLLFHNQERVTADRRCNLHSNMFLLFLLRKC